MPIQTSPDQNDTPISEDDFHVFVLFCFVIWMKTWTSISVKKAKGFYHWWNNIGLVQIAQQAVIKTIDGKR